MKKAIFVVVMMMLMNLTLPLQPVFAATTNSTPQNETETSDSAFVTEINQTAEQNEMLIAETSVTHNDSQNLSTNETTQQLQGETSVPMEKGVTETSNAERNETGKTREMGHWGWLGGPIYYFDEETKEMEVQSGTLRSLYESEAPWTKHPSVKKIIFKGELKYDVNNDNYKDMSGFFKNLVHLTEIEGLEYFDVSRVVKMDRLFENCRNLTKIDISSWETSHVNGMTNLFYGCEGLTELDLSSFDTANVYNMDKMFSSCTNLKSLNVSNFNLAKVTSMKEMFAKDYSLETIDWSNWQASNGAAIITTDIFKDSNVLKSIDLPVASELKLNAEMPIYEDKLTGTDDWVNENNTVEVYPKEELLNNSNRTAGHYYRKQKDYTFKVQYVDQNDKVIADEKTVTGHLGDPYDVTTPEYQLQIPGYTLDTIPANATGTFTDSMQPVIYRYKSFATPTIETKDSTIYQGQAYEASENFIQGTDHLGQELTLDNPNLTLSGDTVDPNAPGEYHQTLTYAFENAETVTSSYTVTVLADQTTAQLQDVRLYVDDDFDANEPFKQVSDKDGQKISADKVHKYFIDEIESRTIDMSQVGEHTVRIQLEKANGDLLDSEKPDAIVTVKKDETAIEARSLELYVDDLYNPAEGFISATNADGENLEYSSEMSWTEDGESIDTAIPGEYTVIYGVPDHKGKMIETVTKVTVKDPNLEIDVTIPTEMLFANSENENLAKEIESNDYQLVNNSTEKALNVELVSFKGEETNEISLLAADEPDPLVESNSLRLNLMAGGTEIINSLNSETTTTQLGTIEPGGNLILAFGGKYFGSTENEEKTEINHELVMKFNVIRD